MAESAVPVGAVSVESVVLVELAVSAAAGLVEWVLPAESVV